MYISKYISNKTRNHNYSRTLDIHLTTNNSEIKELVEVIFDKYFNTGNKEITKKHLEVLLLDLYIAWKTDPMLEIGIHMAPEFYTKVKRYNNE